ncbi:DUF536 domain-containing protein, partial [Staphylococcus saprophyticus]|uniref:DUF536 domain-containing protein n=1 Tax=Staphylococcus saprophyticus TaxID=29385 RepID=UPI0017877198
FNNIKRLNIERIKEENTSFIKQDTHIQKIVQTLNQNNNKYPFQNVPQTKQKKHPHNIHLQSKTHPQILHILKNHIHTFNNQIQNQQTPHQTTIQFYTKHFQQTSKFLQNQQLLPLQTNKNIKKLQHQLHQQTHLNYSFHTSSNHTQNLNPQQPNFTQQTKHFNHQPQNQHPIHLHHTHISQQKHHQNINQKPSTKHHTQFK